jgi:hypothetical protein
MSVAVNAKEPRIITFDAPGAGTGSGQGTGCFSYTDCSTLINNRGAITGYYLDANNVFHGFVRSPDGTFTSFEAPDADTNPNDFNGTLPNAINDCGAITGNYYDVNNVAHGFVRSPEGEITSFDIPDSVFINPIALNQEGVVVGYYINQRNVVRAFLRRLDGRFESRTRTPICHGGSAGCRDRPQRAAGAGGDGRNCRRGRPNAWTAG